MERRLAAILAADVVGYSRLMEADEAGTLAALKSHREGLFDSKIAGHSGRVVKLMGDGALVEFASIVDAVACAVTIQAGMAERNAAVPDEQRIKFRIGVHLGDVIVEGDDLYGDGVNIAARLEGLAEANGICISQQALDQIETKLDLAYEDLGEQQVKNIARPVRAYQILVEGNSPDAQHVSKRRGLSATQILGAALVLLLIVAGFVTALWQPWKPDVEPASIKKMAFPLPDKPSIAVLPLDNLSDEPDQDYFVDGLTETIITELSRFRSLFVIARDSTFNYKGKPVDVRQAAEELGVQFILKGSVQRSTDRLRITAQLIDATTGNHLWAESYDRDLSDIFAVQDEVTESIVASLGAYQGELAEAARERTKRKDPANFSAYDAFLVGMEHKHRFTKADNETAETLFNEAVELDPQFAQAHVGLAWVQIQKFWFGWTDALEQAVAQTREAAEKAIALDPSEAEAHWLLAEAYLADGQFEKSEAAFERALALNPNHADLLAGWGYESVFFGKPERATEFIEKAMRLNPHYPDWYDRGLGTAAYMSRRYEEAIAAFRKVVQHVIPSRLYLAASYAQLGRLEEAQAEVAEAMALDPGISVKKFSRIETYRNPADLAHLQEGLRKAGLREKSPLKLPDKPSIAVLPFNNMSDDASQEYFADGMTEDLITDLSKISGLFVIARNSVFTYKGRAVKVQQVAEELGVRYVLEGSVRRAGNTVRINAQLIDATTGGHMWAERYDGSLADVFALQDKVTGEIVDALALKLTARVSAKSKSTDNAAAYDAFLKGWEHYRLDMPEQYAKALQFFEEATELDPDYDRAWAAMASVYWKAYRQDWAAVLATGSTEARSKAFELIAKVSEKPSLLAYQVTSQMALWRAKFDKAIEAAEHALALDPNDADSQAVLAEALIYNGEPERAEVLIESARRHDPHNEARYAFLQGLGEFGRNQFEAAATSFRRTLELNPVLWNPEGRLGNTYCQPCVVLIAAYGHLGKIDDAQVLIEKIKRDWAGFNIASEYFLWPYRTDTDMKRFTDGLLKAGVAE